MIIESPNYPDGYAENAHELWNVVAPPDQIILLELEDLDLEAGFDYLTVYTGLSAQFDESELIDILSGNEIEHAETTYWSNLWLQFTSDSSTNANGFQLRVTAYDTGNIFVKCIFTPPKKKNNNNNNNYVKRTYFSSLFERKKFKGKQLKSRKVIHFKVLNTATEMGMSDRRRRHSYCSLWFLYPS